MTIQKRMLNYYGHIDRYESITHYNWYCKEKLFLKEVWIEENYNGERIYNNGADVR